MKRVGVLDEKVWAASGQPLWSFPVTNNAHMVTPIVLDDLVICAEYQGRTFAVRVTRTDADWSAEQAWENTEQTQWFGSPVLEGDQPCLGSYAFVRHGGMVRAGDPVRME